VDTVFPDHSPAAQQAQLAASQILVAGSSSRPWDPRPSSPGPRIALAADAGRSRILAAQPRGWSRERGEFVKLGGLEHACLRCESSSSHHTPYLPFIPKATKTTRTRYTEYKSANQIKSIAKILVRYYHL
jgi:hypothetical protein